MLSAVRQRGGWALGGAAAVVFAGGIFGRGEAEHGSSAPRFAVDNVASCEAAPASGTSSKTAFNPKEFRGFKLKSKETISHNTKLYRFALPSANHETGLTVASCLVAKATVQGKTVYRPYTPVSLNHQRGYVDLLIKTYPQPGGLMSRHIDSLEEGEELELKGPISKWKYTANMNKKIGMVAGGTGITPMLQIVREILSNPEDHTEIHLIFANISEADILLRDELDALQYLYPHFKVYYTLDKPPSGWKYGTGFVSAEMIKDRLPGSDEDCTLLICGPKGLVTHVAGEKGKKGAQGELGGLLHELGYKAEQVYKF